MRSLGDSEIFIGDFVNWSTYNLKAILFAGSIRFFTVHCSDYNKFLDHYMHTRKIQCFGFRSDYIRILLEIYFLSCLLYKQSQVIF